MLGFDYAVVDATSFSTLSSSGLPSSDFSFSSLSSSVYPPPVSPPMALLHTLLS